MISIFSRLRKLEVQIKSLPSWQRIPLQVQLANVRARFAKAERPHSPHTLEQQP